MGDLVSATRHGYVLVIRIQREEKRNAINQELAEELDRALNLVEDDADIWVGILTGTPSMFSSRSDVTSKGPDRNQTGRRVWHHSAPALDADHRRGRGDRPRRRSRDSPRLRSRRRIPWRPLRTARGPHRRRADVRRVVPGTSRHAPQPGA